MDLNLRHSGYSGPDVGAVENQPCKGAFKIVTWNIHGLDDRYKQCEDLYGEIHLSD